MSVREREIEQSAFIGAENGAAHLHEEIRTRTPVKGKRGRVAVVRHGEYYQPHPRRDIYALRDAGFDVDVICDSQEGKPHIQHVDGVTVIRVPIRHKRGKMGRYLFEYIAFPLLAGGALALRSIRRRYDYVEIDTMPTWLIVAAAVPKMLGAKVVLYMFEHMAELTATDRGLTERHWFIRLIDAIEMACVRAADRVLTPAERNRELYVERGIPADKIIFIPNCPDESMFLPDGFSFGKSPSSTRSDTYRLVTHGSLLERYGIQILIEAMARLEDEIAGLELDVIGSGEYEPDLMAQAKDLGLADSVNFVGPVAFEKMAERLLRADLGVGPYLLDLLPNKMMEYLLLGIPAIAADWPTMRRYFGDDAVTYVRPNDVDELIEAIRRHYQNPDESRRQAETAQRQYMDSLAWRRTKYDYLGVYGVSRPESMRVSRASENPTLNGNGHKSAPAHLPEEAGGDQDESVVPAPVADETASAGPTKRRGWLGFVLGQSRGPRNALTRLPTIAERFGMSATKSEKHLHALLAVTERHNITPTLFVTGVTARRHPHVIEELHRRGVEIGAHGFVHNDYSQLTRDEQMEQVGLARDEVAALGIRVFGWRCPYSRSNEHTLDAVRNAGIGYDATPAYEWPALDSVGIEMSVEAHADYERLCRLFGVRDASTRAVLPRMVDGLVEIPMSIPQDEDMIDRLHLSAEKLTDVWVWMVRESRRVGEAFVICLHPERAELMAGALDATLAEAKALGDVWVAPLADVAEWWRERAKATVSVRAGRAGNWKIEVSASDRVVTRLGTHSITGSGSYTAKSSKKPVIGHSNLWSNVTLTRIQECGYVVESTEPESVEVYLDDRFEPSADPEIIIRSLAEDERLVRIAPWPAGHQSLLSVTGDIDALTLIDFAMRLKEFS